MDTIYQLVNRIGMIIFIAIIALVVSSNYQFIGGFVIPLLGGQVVIEAFYLKVFCVVLAYFLTILVFFMVCDFFLILSLERKRRLYEDYCHSSRQRT